MNIGSMQVNALYNLALVYRPGIFSSSDYEAIAAEIKKASSDINVFIAPDQLGVDLRREDLSGRPLLTFSPAALKYVTPPRGRIFCGRKIMKSQQMRLLSNGGVRVPKWTLLEPARKYHESDWGRFVILKPDTWGLASKGRGVELVRTASIVYKPPALYAQGAGGYHGDLIVQKFIDTGKYSEDFRVVTMFGRPLYAVHRKSLVEMENLDVTGGNRTSQGVVSNADSGPREVHYCYDEAVLKFASQAYRAIPEVAFQAVDVRREIGTGRLFILEINPGGNTWNFSSARADKLRTIDGIRREDQLGAWKIAAEALIEYTRLYAS